jgi:hypothetical protein
MGWRYGSCSIPDEKKSSTFCNRNAVGSRCFFQFSRPVSTWRLATPSQECYRAWRARFLYSRLLIRAAVHSLTKGVLDFRYESKRQETGFGGNAFCSALRKTLESGVTRSSEVIARERSRVNEWEQIYERLYDDGVASRDSEFDIVGWDSSYTGDPLSRSEMQEQVDFTVDRIRALGGRRILEIGCAPVYCCFAWRIIVPAMWAPISLRLLSPV